MGRSPKVLVIAGSDSSGGAGVQADIKTLTRFGVYAATAITAVTVQSTRGVTAIEAMPLDIVAGQIKTVLGDIGADVVKIGMLGSAALVECVAAHLQDFQGIVVLDPVMVATSGDRLVPEEAVAAMKDHLLPLAHVITPNIPEAALLTGVSTKDEKDMFAASKVLQDLGCDAVVMKGGHGQGAEVVDLLVTPQSTLRLVAPRLSTPHTHGTGCTLSSALAAGLALQQPLETAFKQAHGFVYDAIRTAPGLGQGSGPLNHLSAAIGAFGG